MTEYNPFAPPKTAVLDVRPTACRRDGKFVIVPTGADLPPRCIVCNAPPVLPVKVKKLTWHSPWISVLFLVNVIVYLVVAFIVRKTVSVSPGLCAAHAAARKRRIGIWVAVAAGLVVAGFALLDADEPWSPLCFVAAFIAFVVAMFSSRTVYAREITVDYARLGGCKEPFLRSLE